MRTVRKIRVLIVDDSMLFREVLARGLAADPDLEVVARATDPFDARDKILEFKPDVMTCDIEMPKMNGIVFIRRLLPQYPLPVVVVSTVSHAVFEALNAGAVEFVTKPDMGSVSSVGNFLEDLIEKIKVAVTAQVKIKQSPLLAESPLNKGINTEGKVIAIGASTGGTEAIYSILRNLPPTIPSVVIAQHIPPVFSRLFAERLNDTTRLQVKEAENGDILEPGKVLIAPGDHHMRLKKMGERFRVECSQEEKVNGHRPSIDILFQSVAKEVGPGTIGVLLTGMGYDGAKGLLAMKRKGARTIGQNEASCVVYGMPKVAWEIGAVDKQVALENIPNAIIDLLKRV